ncbi:MAG: YggT family protein [Oceanospirillaceae bacterium]|jgi:YggT family protein
MDSNPLILIIRTVGQLYVFILLLRLVLQLAKADYYNPISQGIVRITQPVIKPLQKIIPKILNIDISPVLLAIVLNAIILYAVYALGSQLIPITSLFLYAVIGVLNIFLDIIFYAVMGSVILSWIAPDSPHPAPQLIMQISSPLYRLVGKVLPSMGGFDLSPILIFIAIQLIQSQLRPFLI